MTTRSALLGGAALLALAIVSTSSPSQAADYVDPGCTLSGSVMAGVMFDWQERDLNFGGDEAEFDVDWTTPFGEGAGLVTCGTLNIQADIAHYAHSGEFEFGDEDEDQTNSHIGGALFYRDSASWAGGVQASWISQSIFGDNIDVFRVGLFGEFYLDGMFTLGGAVAYYNNEQIFSVDEDGFELTAYGRFYATQDFSLLLRGDVLLAESELGDEAGDFDGFAITGEAEYLVWDQGLSLFAGARYAERNLDVDDAFGPGGNAELDIDDMQVFGGIKFYFGQDGTLIERQRSGPIDNTSVFKEKLPNTLLD